MNSPQSCDTFVVLPPLTKFGVIFGKNSDRPQGEVQEVIYVPATSDPGNKIKCTYIEVDSAGPTLAVILSKPGWMWGAEIGANESNVVIGNEAIWSRDTNDDPSVKRLLGMDLVRLGLLYGKTSEDALNTIIKYLEQYGQGGPCSNTDPELCYHNSYLIADPKCAWVLETIGKHWVAKKITEGFYNISNTLTLTTDFDKKSDGLLEYAKENSLWNGDDQFNFALAFNSDSKSGCERYEAGKELLDELTSTKCFCEQSMFGLLRDAKSGICRTIDEAFPTQGSQVSTLIGDGPSIHWFTATPDPSHSVYKPFAFTPNVHVSVHTQCPTDNPSGKHRLYELHEKAIADSNSQVLPLLCHMEKQCVRELNDLLFEIKINSDQLSELDDLFKDCVETEVKFYR